MDEAHQKLERLKELLKGYGRVVVAFSSGVDSTFLLKVAHDLLSDRCVAVTARSCSFPQREQDEAAAFCREAGIRHIVVESEELSIPGFSSNPPNRCYLCKHELFSQMLKVAAAEGQAVVCEGSNVDDLGDYRPGLQAIAELGVASPLRACGFTKREIRALSREMGLPTWRKQSFACLASRFVYGETITPEKLGMVDRAEQLLLDLGLEQVRVRIHGRMARIEVAPERFDDVVRNRERIVEGFKGFGFTYVALDLQGYRTGSMNETLPHP